MSSQEKSKNITEKEVRRILIQFLATYSVRKDMCLPILLMVGKSVDSMLELMVYMRDENPSEHQIIQKAIALSENQ